MWAPHGREEELSSALYFMIQVEHLQSLLRVYYVLGSVLSNLLFLFW